MGVPGHALTCSLCNSSGYTLTSVSGRAQRHSSFLSLWPDCSCCSAVDFLFVLFCDNTSFCKENSFADTRANINLMFYITDKCLELAAMLCVRLQEEFLWKLNICHIFGFADTTPLHQNASGSGNVLWKNVSEVWHTAELLGNTRRMTFVFCGRRLCVYRETTTKGDSWKTFCL